MFSRKLSLCLGSLVLSLAACSADPNPDGDADGSGGSVGDGGTSAGTGAAPGSGAAPGTGGLGNPGSGGSGGGFGPSDGGAPHAGGAGAAPGVGGTAAGGSGGGGATGGSGGGSGDTGGSENGTGGGGGGGDVGPGPSDIPPAPGPDNVPRPSGTPGNITVIDWAGFPAAVTYSFDDNDGSQLTYYEQMKAIGGRYTFFLVTSTQNSGVAISDARWKAIYEDGNEIGNHTTNHSCGTSNIDGANTAIQTTFGRAPSTLAAPNGDTSCTGQAPGRVFLNRGVTPESPVKPNDNSNPYQLNCYIPATGQAASAYNSNIDSALSQKGWVIYVIHGINPGTSHTFQPVSWDGLKGAIEYAKSKNVWIDTLENIGAYWLGQKEFAKAMTQTNGASKTWTWTLPDKFPTGKYLRVKVDGGTLIQDGKPLTWDPHGYYEISLDAKSVTLEP